jgi:hypothetical protein
LWNTEGKNVLGAFATASGGETSLWSANGELAFRASGDAWGGAMSVHGRGNKAAVKASIDESGGILSTFANSGARSMTAGAEEDGCGRLDVYNNADKAVFSVDGQRDLGCVMALNNNVGTTLLGFGTRMEGGLINVMNDRGEPMALLGVVDARAGGITLKNSSGTEIVKIGEDENRDGMVRVKDGANTLMRIIKPVR